MDQIFEKPEDMPDLVLMLCREPLVPTTQFMYELATNWFDEPDNDIQFYFGWETNSQVGRMFMAYLWSAIEIEARKILSENGTPHPDGVHKN